MNFDKKAKDLMQNEVMKQEWSWETLSLWLRDRCKCVYCDESRIGSREDAFFYSHIEHILPKEKYPSLASDPSNLALACMKCNRLKLRWDPNNVEGRLLYVGEGSLSTEVRAGLIARCKEHIKRKENDLNLRFEEQKRLIQVVLDEGIKTE